MVLILRLAGALGGLYVEFFPILARNLDLYTQDTTMYIQVKHAWKGEQRIKMNLVEAKCEIQSEPPKLSVSWLVIELAIIVAIAGLMVQLV